MPVAFDLQPIQSLLHGERGIARYVLDLAVGLQRHHPESVSEFLLNPRFAVPERVKPLQQKLAWHDARPADVTVFHSTSPFELGLPMDEVWPPWARAGCRLVVTLYDLIPLLFPEHYQDTPLIRAHYRSRLELVRRADKVLTISEASARDAVDVLGLRPRQIEVVGAAPGHAFTPPSSIEVARRELASALPSVRPGYLLYTGGVDWRKNVHGLFLAYAQLPERLRRAHQLVIVCSVGDEHLIRYEEDLGARGIADEVVFTGRVADEDLIRLYQAAELFVFPSLYEGYGLPVAEALASGTAVICSRSSSLVELIHDDEALFDPADPDSIAAAIRAALEDPGRRERLRRADQPLGHTWEAVAGATAAAYRSVELLPSLARPCRRRLAVVSPLPPTPSGVADYTAQLLTHLRDWCDVDVFVDRTETASTPGADGVEVYGIPQFEQVEALSNGYDRVLYCIGNQTTHASAMQLLARRPGVVLAHDLRLTGVYAWCAHQRPGLLPDGFQAFLHELYPGRLPLGLGEKGFLDHSEADEFGVFMARRVIEQSTLFLTHSDVASEAARGEVEPEHAGKVETFPFAFPAVVARPASAGPPLVATFGVADPIKQTPKVLEAFGVLAAEHPDVRLAIVGPMPEVVQAEYRARAAELGVEERVTVTGRVSTAEYHDWLSRAAVALQLRASWGGEASAAVADCLAHGVPTVATATGWSVGLPGDALVSVPRDVTPAQLAAETSALLTDEPRQQRLRHAGWDHARRNSFRRVAEQLYTRVVLGVPDWLASRDSASTSVVATSATE